MAPYSRGGALKFAPTSRVDGNVTCCQGLWSARCAGCCSGALSCANKIGVIDIGTNSETRQSFWANFMATTPWERLFCSTGSIRPRAYASRTLPFKGSVRWPSIIQPLESGRLQCYPRVVGIIRTAAKEVRHAVCREDIHRAAAGDGRTTPPGGRDR